MLIALCVYLWLCCAGAGLVGLSFIRPIHGGDVLTAIAFPLLFPFAVLRELIRRAAPTIPS